MAKKEQELTASMIDTFREFKETKNIDRTTLVSVLEESFRNVLAKIFGSDENFDVIVNPDKGDFEIYRNRIVVADGEVEDEEGRAHDNEVAPRLRARHLVFVATALGREQDTSQQ